jgi:uncharacterized integral membrane protein (TIGR00698 family)
MPIPSPAAQVNPLGVPGLSRVLSHAPGVLLCAVIALAASFLAEHHGGPSLLYALLLGLSLHFLAANERLGLGLAVCSRLALRAGVALLGMRITMHQVTSLGAVTASAVIAGVLLTIAAGWLLEKFLRRPSEEGIISGCAVGICGASAALAVSAMLPQTRENEKFTLLTMVGVTLLSTVAMVLYPLGLSIAGVDAHRSGIFLGATIHDVAQVVAAGMIIGPQAADSAAIVKLFRVALLAPIVFLLALVYRRRAELLPDTRRPPLIPGFLLAFAAFVLCSSLGWISPEVASTAGHASRWLLMLAIAAAEIKTNLADLAKLGWMPVLMLVSETALIAIVALVTVATA